jgi:hypothetical protein
MIKKPLLVGVGIGFLLGLCIVGLPFPGRYKVEIPIRTDTWTGKTWRITSEGWKATIETKPE